MKAGHDPLLASWRYGLGRVTAFTSDLTGRWGREWVTWESFPRWIGQVARHTALRAQESSFRSEFAQDGEEVICTFDLFGEGGSYQNHQNLKASVVGPGGDGAEMRFQQVAPGRYEARFRVAQGGVLLLTIIRAGEASPLATVPFLASNSKEYGVLETNGPLLERLAKETGGRVLNPKTSEAEWKQLFTAKPGEGREPREIWRLLACLGLGFFLADIGFRRFYQRSQPA
jgi:hypothetical protein